MELSERRHFERISCYMIARRPGATEENDFFGVVRNIAPGGAMIETDYPASIGDQLDLAFMLDEEHQVWEGRGRVVWARRKDEKTIFGLQFTRLLEESTQGMIYKLG